MEKSFIMIDCHIHNKYSSDAKGSVHEYCKKALENSIKYITFTNHAEKYSEKLERYEVSYNKFKDCYEKEKEEIIFQRENFPDLKITQGVEFENRFKYIDEMLSIYEDFEFDVIIGAAHVVDDISISGENGIDYIKSQSEDVLYNKYFDAVLEVIDTLDIDVFAHFDIVKRYACEIFGPFKLEPYKKRVKEILEKFKEKDITLEVNTSGLRQFPKETYPGIDIVKMAFEIGLDFSIGSDTHIPKTLGYEIMDILSEMKKIGVKEVAFFNKRQKKYLTI